MSVYFVVYLYVFVFCICVHFHACMFVYLYVYFVPGIFMFSVCCMFSLPLGTLAPCPFYAYVWGWGSNGPTGHLLDLLGVRWTCCASIGLTRLGPHASLSTISFNAVDEARELEQRAGGVAMAVARCEYRGGEVRFKRACFQRNTYSNPAELKHFRGAGILLVNSVISFFQW